MKRTQCRAPLRLYCQQAREELSSISKQRSRRIPLIAASWHGERIMSKSRAGSQLHYRGAMNLDAHCGQRKGGRAVHYRPIDAAVLAAVARAVDGAAGHGV